MSAFEYARRVVSLGLWAYGVWLLLTWTATAEQLLFGAGLGLICGLALAPLGPVVAPWEMFHPLRLVAIARLLGHSAVRIVRANVSLAVRVWRPSRPLRSGMVIVPTTAQTDGELAAVGVITSLIVDNQIVDLDHGHNLLQYHAVWVPEGDKAEAINATTERAIARVRRAR